MTEGSVTLDGVVYRYTNSGQVTGGSGFVCKCWSPSNNNLMLKVLKEDSKSIKRERFLNEIEFQKKMISGVVPVIASGFFDEEKKQPCYVMPRYECNLAEKMSESKSFFDSIDWCIQ